jgi:RND family efflux transporter MFP subunit
MKALLLALLFATPALAQDAPRPVVSEIVSADALRQRSFTGVIEAEQRATLAFQTAGRLASLPWQVGDRVQAGQTLATLDQVTLAEDVDTAQAALDSAQAAAETAAQNLARVQELANRGVAPAATLDAARRAAATAQAQAGAAAADLKRAQDAAGFGTLTAPAEGVVLSIAARPGTVVAAGAPILTLALGTGREAVLDVPADYLGLLTPGRTFTLQGRVPGVAPLTGTLRLIEPVADSSTRSRRIRVTLADPPPAWRIGSLVTAELAAESQPVITLPLSAIAGTPDAPQVWTVTGTPRTAHDVVVTLGATLGDRVVVTKGLSIGDEVVVKGVHSLTEGQPVGERVE